MSSHLCYLGSVDYSRPGLATGLLLHNATASADERIVVVVSTQVRACRVGACSAPIPATLLRHGVCLGHYLDDVFTRISAVQERANQNELPDSRTLTWLRQQGDFAVALLSNNSPEITEDRSRLLELLLCLANLHESLRRLQSP